MTLKNNEEFRNETYYKKAHLNEDHNTYFIRRYCNNAIFGRLQRGVCGNDEDGCNMIIKEEKKRDGREKKHIYGLTHRTFRSCLG